MPERLAPWPAPRGAIPGASWPAILDDNRAAILALAHTLEQTEWLPTEEIRAGQLAQLGELAAYAASRSPAFAARLRDCGLQPHDLSQEYGLSRLPPLTRRDLQAKGAEFFCTEYPPAHGAMAEVRTSGSTGQPVTMRRTALTQHFWAAFTLREHRWQRRDWSLPLAAIRSGASFVRHESWGAPVSLLFDTGPAFTAPATAPVPQLAQWLAESDPAYLIAYPSILRLLLGEVTRRGLRVPALREIRTQGETLPPDMRRQAEALGCRLTDNYSAEEVGVIALPCPAGGLYHTMAEGLLVEILAEDGRLCQPGETGKVVITDLHNFAAPLIRYAIGDYAEAGLPCPCGRGLPTLARIRGRTRNMVVTPEGRRWLTIEFHELAAIFAIRQYQIVQKSLHGFEVRLVVGAPLAEAQEKQLASVIRTWLENDKAVLQFVYNDRFLSSGGKFEEFICAMPAAACL